MGEKRHKPRHITVKFQKREKQGLFKLSFRENTAQKRIKNQNDFRLGGKTISNLEKYTETIM